MGKRNLDLDDALRTGQDSATGFVWRMSGQGTVTATDEIVGGAASVEYPTSSVEWFIASTDTNDTIAGTGAQKVDIIYLDDSFDIQNVTIDMNGQTAVSIAEGMRILLAKVVQDGTTADFDGSNAAPLGTVHIGRGPFTLGVPAKPFIKIPVGKGESKTSLFTVPRGYRAFLQTATVSSPKNDDFIFTNWASTEDGPWAEGGSVISTEGITHLPGIFSGAAPEKTDLQVRGKAIGASAVVDSIIDLKVLKV